MLSISRVAIISLSFLSFVAAHTVITYPGWRGNNLHSSGTVLETDGMISGESENGTIWPYGMQWDYPCGGMPTSTNRTKWPVRGGAIAVQPGWFPGHLTAFFYMNLGMGTVPLNMSLNMVPAFQINGPTKDTYPGTFCLPQVPLPANLTVNVGDNATIQVIETAVHGAALYNCVDITFAEPEDVEEVNEQNCFNSSDISMQLIFSTTSLDSAGFRSITQPSILLASISAFVAIASLLLI